MFYSGICAKVLLYCVHDIYAFWLPKTDLLAMFCLHAMSFRRQMAVFYFITSSVMFISCDDSETKANKSQYNDSVSNRICATDLSQCPSDVVCLQESDTHCMYLSRFDAPLQWQRLRRRIRYGLRAVLRKLRAQWRNLHRWRLPMPE